METQMTERLMIENSPNQPTVVDPKDATMNQWAEWINQAKTPLQRNYRKTYAHPYLYSSGPEKIINTLMTNPTINLPKLFSLHENMKELEHVMKQRKEDGLPASVMEAKFHKARIEFEEACGEYEKQVLRSCGVVVKS